MNHLQSGTPVSFLYVRDRERALNFYCEKLGFRLRSSDGFGDFIDLGTGLMRMTVMPDYSASPHPVLGWNVRRHQCGGSGTARRRHRVHHS